MKAFLVRVGQAVGSIVAVVVALAAGGIIGVAPLMALPGGVNTDFVGGSWVLPIWVGFLGALLWARLGPLTQRKDDPWWPSTLRFVWRFLSSFVGFFWVSGFLVWFNSYGIQEARTHDMRIVGYEERRVPGAVSTNNHFKLVEIGTGWQTDLQPTYERDTFVKIGSCAQVTVRRGRLGLDFISDARSMKCHD